MWSPELNWYNSGWLWSLDESEVEVEITHWMPKREEKQVIDLDKVCKGIQKLNRGF